MVVKCRVVNSSKAHYRVPFVVANERELLDHATKIQIRKRRFRHLNFRIVIINCWRFAIGVGQ